MFDNESACGNQILSSTATITAEDSGLSADDTSVVEVFVSCGDNCVYESGFWKNHTDDWPNIGDWDFDLAPEQENEDLALHNSWINVFKTAPTGNLWYQLARQWMTAYLNALNGADISALGVALNDAWSWIENHSGVNVKPNSSPQAKAWLNLFSSYNQGLLGSTACK